VLEQELYGDGSIEFRVVSLVNLTHSSFAEKPIDSVGADLRTFGQRGASGAIGAWVGRLGEHARNVTLCRSGPAGREGLLRCARSYRSLGFLSSLFRSEPNLNDDWNDPTHRNMVMLFGHIHELVLCIDTKHASGLSFSPDKQASPAAGH
jgi:hypothetical protein